MALYKRGTVYWCEIEYAARRYRKSTGVKDHRTAAEIENAFRTALVTGEAFLPEDRTGPSFRYAMADFLRWSKVRHHISPGEQERDIGSLWEHSTQQHHARLCETFRNVEGGPIRDNRQTSWQTSRHKQKSAACNRKSRASLLESLFHFRHQSGFDRQKSSQPHQVSASPVGASWCSIDFKSSEKRNSRRSSVEQRLLA